MPGADGGKMCVLYPIVVEDDRGLVIDLKEKKNVCELTLLCFLTEPFLFRFLNMHNV